MLRTILMLSPFVLAAAVTFFHIITAKKAAQSREIRCNCCAEARKCSFGFINMLSDAPIRFYLDGCDDTCELDSGLFPELDEKRTAFRRFSAVYAVMCIWSLTGMRKNILNIVLLHKNGILPAFTTAAVLWFMFAALFTIPFIQYLKCTELACKYFNESNTFVNTPNIPSGFDILNNYRRNKLKK